MVEVRGPEAAGVHELAPLHDSNRVPRAIGAIMLGEEGVHSGKTG
jgi:hypothetical protein